MLNVVNLYEFPFEFELQKTKKVILFPFPLFTILRRRIVVIWQGFFGKSRSFLNFWRVILARNFGALEVWLRVIFLVKTLGKQFLNFNDSQYI